MADNDDPSKHILPGRGRAHGLGGNFTRGPLRRGNRGRPPVEGSMSAVKLSDHQRAVARYYGLGNVSLGVRAVLDAVAPFLRNPSELLDTISRLSAGFRYPEAAVSMTADVRQALALLGRAVPKHLAGEEQPPGITEPKKPGTPYSGLIAENAAPVDLFANVEPKGNIAIVDDTGDEAC